MLGLSKGMWAGSTRGESSTAEEDGLKRLKLLREEGRIKKTRKKIKGIKGGTYGGMLVKEANEIQDRR